MTAKMRGRPRPEQTENPPEVELVEAETDLVEITKATMAGDLIAATLDELKAAPTVWQKMSEAQQQEVIHRVTNRVTHNIAQAVMMIAAEARPSIRAKLAAVTIKDDLKATVLLSRHHPDRHEFIDSAGQEILIVLLNAEQFAGGAGDAKPDPDQPELPMQDGDGAGAGAEGDDPLLADAVKRVTETGKCSIAFVQRDLRIGYNRAAHLVEAMEQKGVISPANASGHRQVLVADA